MAKSKPTTPSPETSNAAEPVDPVEQVLAENPEIAAELENLTRGEQIIRLRQRGLVDFDVQ